MQEVKKQKYKAMITISESVWKQAGSLGLQRSKIAEQALRDHMCQRPDVLRLLTTCYKCHNTVSLDAIFLVQGVTPTAPNGYDCTYMLCRECYYHPQQVGNHTMTLPQFLAAHLRDPEHLDKQELMRFLTDQPSMKYLCCLYGAYISRHYMSKEQLPNAEECINFLNGTLESGMIFTHPEFTIGSYYESNGYPNEALSPEEWI